MLEQVKVWAKINEAHRGQAAAINTLSETNDFDRIGVGKSKQYRIKPQCCS